MVFSTALAASLMLGFAACGQVNHRTDKRMAMDETNFFAADFQMKRQNSMIRTRWVTSDLASVSVTLRNEGPERTLELSWEVSTADFGQGQILLANPPSVPQPAAYDCILEISRYGQKTMVLAWDTQSEPDSLRQMRVLLEKIGHSRYSEAAALLRRGSAWAGAGKFAEAIQTFRAGIEVLGTMYRDPSGKMIDDTGMKLVLAESSEREGKLQQAAAVYERVLESRTTVYARRFPPKE